MTDVQKQYKDLCQSIDINLKENHIFHNFRDAFYFLHQTLQTCTLFFSDQHFHTDVEKRISFQKKGDILIGFSVYNPHMIHFMIQCFLGGRHISNIQGGSESTFVYALNDRHFIPLLSHPYDLIILQTSGNDYLSFVPIFGNVSSDLRRRMVEGGFDAIIFDENI